MNPAIYTPCLSPFSLQSATVSILPSPKQASIVNRSNERATPSLFRSLGYFSLHLKEYVRSCVCECCRSPPRLPARASRHVAMAGTLARSLGQRRKQRSFGRPDERGTHSEEGKERAETLEPVRQREARRNNKSFMQISRTLKGKYLDFG